MLVEYTELEKRLQSTSLDIDSSLHVCVAGRRSQPTLVFVFAPLDQSASRHSISSTESVRGARLFLSSTAGTQRG